MSVYYVGPGGDDANNGTTWALRKLTLNGAEDIPVAPADIVYVAPGVYRELLTCDVSGNAGNPITYIGDYTGANTDGVGGVVRITGSDDDITATRNNCIIGTTKTYRTFRGFTLDMAAAISLFMATGCTNWIVDQFYIVAHAASVAVTMTGLAQSTNTIKNSYITAQRGQTCIYISHSAVVDDSAHVIQNCIIQNAFIGIAVVRVGGITVRNCIIGPCASEGITISTALTAGQTLTVNNCIIHNCGTGLKATTTAEFVEDYNAVFACLVAARTNVDVGANSNAYPPLYDPRWFFEAVNGGKVLTPFDLASYSQLVNVAGTSPTTTDLRGTAVQGAQREWGALEYDATYYLPRVATVLDSAGGTYHAPSVGEVIDTAVFGPASGTDGTFAIPAEADVKDGVFYGAAGTEFEGELAGGGMLAANKRGNKL